MGLTEIAPLDHLHPDLRHTVYMAHTFKLGTTIARLAILPMVALLAAQQAPAPTSKAPASTAPGNSGPTATKPQGDAPMPSPEGVDYFDPKMQGGQAPAANPGPSQAPMAVTPVQPAVPVDARQAIKFEPEILNLGEMSAEVAKTGKIVEISP